LIFLVYALSFLVSAQVFASVRTVRVAERLEIDFNKRIGADLLCQDGREIYFANKAACDEANKQLNEKEYFACEYDFYVAPIQEMEELKLDSDNSVYRYFSIPTEYSVRVYQAPANSPTRLRLVKTVKKSIPLCDGREIQPPTPVHNARAELSPDLRKLLTELNEQGLSLIESPRGQVEAIAEPSGPYVVESGGLKSPLCDVAVREDLLKATGGETSGGGWSKLNPGDLIGIGKPVSVDHQILGPKRGFEVSCEKTAP